ncbi:MAG: response regulator [Acidobacteria bacterium]|nr:response regulator [Acidobacteriota bacterium]
MSAKKTILIVEDEADEVSYLTALFEDHGFAVITAADGKEGFNKAKSQRPDLITLDISMPEETGVRMFRDLQGDPETCAIPVVMITGISHDFKRFIETRRQVRPPEGYFDKPPDPEQLMGRINQILGAGNSRN